MTLETLAEQAKTSQANLTRIELYQQSASPALISRLCAITGLKATVFLPSVDDLQTEKEQEIA